jgi:hypothetical protein
LSSWPLRVNFLSNVYMTWTTLKCLKKPQKKLIKTSKFCKKKRIEFQIRSELAGTEFETQFWLSVFPLKSYNFLIFYFIYQKKSVFPVPDNIQEVCLREDGRVTVWRALLPLSCGTRWIVKVDWSGSFFFFNPTFEDFLVHATRILSLTHRISIEYIFDIGACPIRCGCILAYRIILFTLTSGFGLWYFPIHPNTSRYILDTRWCVSDTFWYVSDMPQYISDTPRYILDTT